jgi:hypothetical protein
MVALRVLVDRARVQPKARYICLVLKGDSKDLLGRMAAVVVALRGWSRQAEQHGPNQIPWLRQVYKVRECYEGPSSLLYLQDGWQMVNNAEGWVWSRKKWSRGSRTEQQLEVHY